MVESHWEIIHQRLQKCVARARACAQAHQGLLSDKLALKRLEQDAREKLRQHPLAFECKMTRPACAGPVSGPVEQPWAVTRSEAAATLRRARRHARRGSCLVQRTAPGCYRLQALDTIVLATGVRPSVPNVNTEVTPCHA